MKIQIKNDIGIGRIVAGVIAIAFLVVVFYVSDLPLIILVLLAFLGIHLHYFRKASAKLFLQLGFLLALTIFTAHAVMEYQTFSALYIPVASVAMLTVLLYNDLQMAFLMSLMASVIVGLIVGGDLQLVLTFLVGSLAAIYPVKGARTRGKLIGTGIMVGLLQVACIVILNPWKDFFLAPDFFTVYAKPLFISGLISTFVVIAALKVFEFLFGVLTNFSLLELADFNQPLLKRMILEAPGTYHHSLVTSNLAEAAAEAVGAHSLLVRVGAYYHDIGKLVKPEYFTENQMLEGDKHHSLEPHMSRLVILNHVKEGVELAQKYHLNGRIIDFIQQHHGDSLIYYFYRRALEGAMGDETVDQQNFRYDGPKPQSREIAIVLLADSVEGAVRSVEEPTPGRIDEVVRRVINNKFIDGQLDSCDLALKDLETISMTFTRVLTAMYHTRVKYPERTDENTNNHRKSSEKDSSSAHPVNQDNYKNPEA